MAYLESNLLLMLQTITLFLTVLLAVVQVHLSLSYGTAHPLHGHMQVVLPRAEMPPPLPLLLCGQSWAGDTPCRISLMGSNGSGTVSILKPWYLG